MRKSKLSESQIVAILKEAEVGVVPVAHLPALHSGARPRSSSRAASTPARQPDVKRLRELEAENAKVNGCMRI